jgi:hypothetical protein
MDQFLFNKKFACAIVADLRSKRLNSSPQTLLRQHEANIFNKNDENLPRHAQKGEKQFNSSLQNPSKRGAKGI